MTAVLEYKVCAGIGAFDYKSSATTFAEYKAATPTVAAVSDVTIDRHGPVGEVQFYAAVTGVKDAVGDIITPGAFARTLRERMPRVCLGHDWNRPIGRTVEVKELMPGDPNLPSETADGKPWPHEAGVLWVKALYNLDTEDGKNAFADARFMGKQAMYSIGYIATRKEHKGDTRHLHEIDLYEYGPVLHPANALASGISTKRTDTILLETKARYVRDSDFWGLPIGTPITPGMKPRGKLAVAKRRRGEVPSRSAGTMDRAPDVAERQELESRQAQRSTSAGLREISEEESGEGLFDAAPGAARVRASRRARGADAEHLDAVDADASRDEDRAGASILEGGAERTDLAVHELSDRQREGLRGLLDEGITPDEVDDELPDDIDPEHRDSIMAAYRHAYDQRAEQQGGKPSPGGARAPEVDQPAPEQSFGEAARAQREGPASPDAFANVDRGTEGNAAAADALERDTAGTAGEAAGRQRAAELRGQTPARIDDPAVDRAGLAEAVRPKDNLTPSRTVRAMRSEIDRMVANAPREQREPIEAAATMAKGMLARGVDTDPGAEVRGLRRAMEHAGVDDHEMARRLDAIDAMADALERRGLGNVKGKGRVKSTVTAMRDYAHAARRETGLAPETDYRDQRSAGADPGLPDAAPGSQPSDTPSDDRARAAAEQIAGNRGLGGDAEQVAARRAENEAAIAAARPGADDPAAVIAPARAQQIAGEFLSPDGRRGRGTVQDAGRYTDAELEAAARVLDGRGAPGATAAAGLRDFATFRARESERRQQRPRAGIEIEPEPGDLATPEQGRTRRINALIGVGGVRSEAGRAQLRERVNRIPVNEVAELRDHAQRELDSGRSGPRERNLRALLDALDERNRRPDSSVRERPAPREDVDRVAEAESGMDQRFRDADDAALRDSIAQNNRLISGRAGTSPTGSRDRLADQNRRMQAELNRREDQELIDQLTDDEVDRAISETTAQLDRLADQPGAQRRMRQRLDLLRARRGDEDTPLDLDSPATPPAPGSTPSAVEQARGVHYDAGNGDWYNPDGSKWRPSDADDESTLSADDLAELDALGDPDTLGSTDPRAAGPLGGTAPVPGERDARRFADQIIEDGQASTTQGIGQYAVTGNQREFLRAGDARPDAATIADAALARQIALGNLDLDEARRIRDGAEANRSALPHAAGVRAGDVLHDPDRPNSDMRVHTTSLDRDGNLVLRAVDQQTQDAVEVIAPPDAVVHRRSRAARDSDTRPGDPDTTGDARPADGIVGTGGPDLTAREAAAAMAGDEGDGFTAEEDAAARVGVSADELDEARAGALAEADERMGVTELPDGDVEVTPEVAERQNRVEDMLTRRSAGRLDLSAQTDEQLGSTRRDLVDELAMQDSMHRRNPAAYRQSGGRGQSGRRGQADGGTDAPEGDEVATSTPTRRPGVAGAAEDYADALDAGIGVEEARSNLLSSLRRSGATGQAIDALRAHLGADDADDGTEVRRLAAAMRAEVRARRNASARRRRTAKRLDRDRIRSMIGQVDTVMRGRSMNPEEHGGAVADWMDAARIDAVNEAAASRSPALYALTEDDEDRKRLADGRMINAQYRERVAFVESKAAEAIDAGMETHVAHADGFNDDGVPKWTPERHAQHQQLIDDFWAEHVAHVPREGKAMFSGGLGGAGKGTILGKDNLAIDKRKFAGIDPDEIKEMLVDRGMVDVPKGVSPMEMATLMHEESSYLSKVIQARAIEERRNIILDNTMAGKNGDKVRKIIATLRSNGYDTIDAAFVEIPVEESVKRALSRHRGGADRYMKGKGNGGRYVPPAVIRASADPDGIRSSQNIKNFEEIADLFDNWAHYDNSGSAPVFVKGKGNWATDPRLRSQGGDGADSPNDAVLVPTSSDALDTPDVLPDDPSTTVSSVSRYDEPEPSAPGSDSDGAPGVAFNTAGMNNRDRGRVQKHLAQRVQYEGQYMDQGELYERYGLRVYQSSDSRHPYRMLTGEPPEGYGDEYARYTPIPKIVFDAAMAGRRDGGDADAPGGDYVSSRDRRRRESVARRSARREADEAERAELRAQEGREYRQREDQNRRDQAIDQAVVNARNGDPGPVAAELVQAGYTTDEAEDRAQALISVGSDPRRRQALAQQIKHESGGRAFGFDTDLIPEVEQARAAREGNARQADAPVSREEMDAEDAASIAAADGLSVFEMADDGDDLAPLSAAQLAEGSRTAREQRRNAERVNRRSDVRRFDAAIERIDAAHDAAVPDRPREHTLTDAETRGARRVGPDGLAAGDRVFLPEMGSVTRTDADGRIAPAQGFAPYRGTVHTVVRVEPDAVILRAPDGTENRQVIPTDGRDATVTRLRPRQLGEEHFEGARPTVQGLQSALAIRENDTRRAAQNTGAQSTRDPAFLASPELSDHAANRLALRLTRNQSAAKLDDVATNLLQADQDSGVGEARAQAFERLADLLDDQGMGAVGPRARGARPVAENLRLIARTYRERRDRDTPEAIEARFAEQDRQRATEQRAAAAADREALDASVPERQQARADAAADTAANGSVGYARDAHTERAMGAGLSGAPRAMAAARSGDITPGRVMLANAIPRPSDYDRRGENSEDDAHSALRSVLRGEDIAGRYRDVGGTGALPSALAAQADAIRERMATADRPANEGRLGRLYRDLDMGAVADVLDAEADRMTGGNTRRPWRDQNSGDGGATISAAERDAVGDPDTPESSIGDLSTTVNGVDTGTRALSNADARKIERARGRVDGEDEGVPRRLLGQALTGGSEAMPRAADDAVNVLSGRGDRAERVQRARDAIAENERAGRGTADDVRALAAALREDRDGRIGPELASVARELADDLDEATGAPPDTGMRTSDELRVGDQFYVRGRGGATVLATVTRAKGADGKVHVRQGRGVGSREFTYDKPVQVLNYDRTEPTEIELAQQRARSDAPEALPAAGQQRDADTAAARGPRDAPALSVRGERAQGALAVAFEDMRADDDPEQIRQLGGYYDTNTRRLHVVDRDNALASLDNHLDGLDSNLVDTRGADRADVSRWRAERTAVRRLRDQVAAMNEDGDARGRA